MVKVGLIPAAGAGVRAYPTTNYIPKVMLEIAGKPIILRNIEIMRDKIGIKDIYVITGYMGETIRHFLGDGSNFGVDISYIDCRDPSIGLARGVALAREKIRENFVTMLGDEVYIDSHHEAVKDFAKSDYSAVCGVLHTNDFNMIAKNYTVTIKDGRIVDLKEKPQRIRSGILGCGTYIFTPEIFDAIERTAPSQKSGKVELTDAINTLVKDGKAAYPLYLDGLYYNINSAEDYNYINYVYRSVFFDTFKTSVIIPAYNEEGSIVSVIRDFIDKVDEVFVVDNSSGDGTKDVSEKAGAKVETVRLKGYGDTIRYGLDHAKGDILIIVEADYSFRAKDLKKFFEYMKDADMVIGTRTTRQMIEQGSNMKGLLRWGNVFVGKLVEVLWWSQEPRFTDVGCTYRAIWKDAYVKIKNNLATRGPEFSLEMMIEILRARKRIIEIPVSYYNRLTGMSKHSENYFKISRTALRMLKMIFKKKFNL